MQSKLDQVIKKIQAGSQDYDRDFPLWLALTVPEHAIVPVSIPYNPPVIEVSSN